MKITVTHQVRLNDEDQKIIDAICEGLTIPEIAEDWEMEKKKVQAMKTKVFRKLMCTSPLELYKLVHTDCPHCGKDIEYLPFGLRPEKKK